MQQKSIGGQVVRAAIPQLNGNLDHIRQMYSGGGVMQPRQLTPQIGTGISTQAPQSQLPQLPTAAPLIHQQPQLPTSAPLQTPGSVPLGSPQFGSPMPNQGNLNQMPMQQQQPDQAQAQLHQMQMQMMLERLRSASPMQQPIMNGLQAGRPAIANRVNNGR